MRPYRCSSQDPGQSQETPWSPGRAWGVPGESRESPRGVPGVPGSTQGVPGESPGRPQETSKRPRGDPGESRETHWEHTESPGVSRGGTGRPHRGSGSPRGDPKENPRTAPGDPKVHQEGPKGPLKTPGKPGCMVFAILAKGPKEDPERNIAKHCVK